MDLAIKQFSHRLSRHKIHMYDGQNKEKEKKGHEEEVEETLLLLLPL